MTRFFSLLLLAALFVGCGGAEGTEVDATDAVDPEATQTEMKPSAVYNVDASASVLNWEGAKPTGSSHTGTIPVQAGKIMVADGNIVGGEFTLNIAGMTNTDLPADKAAKLLGHLKSGDFFETEKFPTATFTITSVQPATGMEGITHKVSGNLMMKGQSKNITIPTNVSMDGGMLKAAAPAFTIDRTEWGVVYNSGSLADVVKDNIINDEVGLELMLVAKK